jgi:hypothetical protein
MVKPNGGEIVREACAFRHTFARGSDPSAIRVLVAQLRERAEELLRRLDGQRDVIHAQPLVG